MDLFFFFLFLFESGNGETEGTVYCEIIYIWKFVFPLVIPHLFSKTTTWAALSIAKVNSDITPEILKKTKWYSAIISL